MGGVIVVDAAGVGLLVSDVMPIYMIIALDIVMIIRFSINCPTVICLPTVCYVLEREASNENYGPRIYFNHIKNPKIPCPNFILFYLQFTLMSITVIINPCK